MCFKVKFVSKLKKLLVLVLLFKINILWSQDTIAPVITPNPGANGCIEVDCLNMPYVDPGASAYDNVDGNITSSIITFSNVRTNRVGQYTVTYIVFDKSGNSDTFIRHVCVENTKEPPGFKLYNKGNEFLFTADHQVSRVRNYFKWILDGDTMTQFNDEIVALATINDHQEHTMCYLENQCNDTTFTICQKFIDTIGDRHWVVIKSFRDLNNNCVKDNTDEYVIGAPVLVDANNQYAVGMPGFFGGYSYFLLDSNKLYKLRLWPSNTDTFSYTCLMHDTIIQPRTYKDTTLELSFAYNCVKRINDFYGGYAGVFNRAYPNETTDLYIWVGNLNYHSYKTCETIDSGLLKVSISGPAQLKKVKTPNVRVDVFNSKYAEVFYDNLNMGNMSSNNLYELYVEPTAKLGDTIFVDAEIVGYGVEPNYANNKRRSYIKVKSAYDPNNKLVDSERVLPGFKDALEYTINFQNTGNAEAKNIVIVDTISQKLDTSKLQFICSSHTCKFKLNGQVLKLYFDSINLPDSHTNQVLSHGFATFTIPPKDTLKHLEAIQNTAFIYFDFNPPIVTNTAYTVAMYKGEIVSISNADFNSIRVFPNPVKDKLLINDPNAILKSAELFDVTGKLVLANTNILEFTQLDMSQMPEGVYVLKLKTLDGIKCFKVLK